eukprot:XP_011420066.1 PREDICTED: uncharacterized protein LOC105322863 [Crassostrea gigas]
MNFQTFLIVTEVMVLQLQYCKPSATGLAWKTANEQCRLQNDSIVNIKDVRNKLSFLTGLKPIWSPVKGQFTPWIAYRGCFGESSSICVSLTGAKFTNKKCHTILNNTVGNCYFECRSKSKSDGGCETTSNFYFGLQESICLCLCDNSSIQHISESKKCNILCKTCINNGECGGKGFFSVYESKNVVIPDTGFGGFCLSCRSQNGSGKALLYSIDCNENAAGLCVESNEGSSSLPPTMSTFDSYWRYCRNHSKYIVGDTSQTFCQRDASIWTGLRKYKIDNFNTDTDSCYIFEIQNGTVNYKERSCTEHHFFLCKKEFNQKYISSTKYVKSTTYTSQPPFTSETALSNKSWPTRGNATSKFIASTNSPSSKSKASTSNKGLFTWTANTSLSKKSFTFSVTTLKTSFSNTTSRIITTSLAASSKEENKATIVGSSIAGVVVLISVVFIAICLFKRRNLLCIQSKQQQAKSGKVFNNTTYDDLVVTNQKPDVNYANTTLEYANQGSICKIDDNDIYVEKEDEYDHLHTSRQKHVAKQVDDDRYGSASYFDEDSYSTLRQNKNIEPCFDNEYSGNITPYSGNQLRTMKSPDYDFCYQSNQRKDW